MGLTGDFAQLRRLIAEIESAGTKILPAATRAAAEGAGEQYQADFTGQHDPFGTAWAPSPHHMFVSGALANPQITSSSGIVRIRPEKYWAMHQVGAHGMAVRAILPFAASNWDPPIQAKIGDIVIGHFTGS
jgi:hypothetical protein